MVVDTSALLAILFGEPEGPGFAKKILLSNHKVLPSTCYLEARLKIHSLNPATVVDLENLLVHLKLTIYPIGEVVTRIAADAHLAYGKGIHSAGLNFGDCYSYAVAKNLKMPLLFKGDDFSRTDMIAA